MWLDLTVGTGEASMQETSAGSDSAPVDEIPLFGRKGELAALTEALAQAAAGHGRCIMLAGDPGVGKTSLAKRTAAHAVADGFVVAWGRCWEGGGAPAFWPWIQIVRTLTEELGTEKILDLMGPGAPYIAQVVPELGQVLEETAPAIRKPERDRFVMFDATSTFFRQLAKEKPLVLIFDDLHAADEPSLHLLRFLSSEAHRSSVLILGTYVDSEVNRDAVLSRLLHGMVREGRVLNLRGLSKEDVAELYEVAAGEAPPEPVLTAVHQATEGNPFFVDEAMRLMKSKGDLRRPDYSLGFRVPKGARGVLDRRLTPLSDELIWVLSIAAVIGRDFEFGTLQEVAEIDTSPLLDVLQKAIDAGVINELGSQGRYTFSHILLREVLYEELTTGDRMRLHNEVAQVIEERFRDDLDARLDELAHHYFKAAQAGDKAKAIDYALRAARKATSTLAYEEAVRLYRRALRVAELAGASKIKRQEISAALNEAEARVGGDVASEEGPTVLAEIRGLFSQQGEFWEIEFEGRKFRLRDSKGLRYLSQLLKNPGREIHSLDIVSVVEGRIATTRATGAAADPSLEVTGLGDAGAVLDAQAKGAYKRRIRELQEDIDEAEAFNDPERAANAQEEMDALLQQLSGAVGLGGRDRKAASAAEKARLSVTKAIKPTLAKIEANHPALGAHFGATIRTGTYCSYRPDPRVPISWDF